jgi:ABC-type sugar transport system substrate-binding protein
MGRLQGERMAKILGGRGKVACMGILGMENMEAGFKGFQDALKAFPAIRFLGNTMIKQTWNWRQNLPPTLWRRIPT